MGKQQQQRQVRVQVEKLQERYCGALTGATVYHTSEAGCSGLFRGCPLGRGYSEAESIRDFVVRANADDSTLKLTVKEVIVVARRNYV